MALLERRKPVSGLFCTEGFGTADHLGKKIVTRGIAYPYTPRAVSPVLNLLEWEFPQQAESMDNLIPEKFVSSQSNSL